MKNIISLITLTTFTFLFTFSFQAQQRLEVSKERGPVHRWVEKEENGYTYKYVTEDPSEARFYTLANGLTVVLSPSKKKPRIQTFLAVKAGSKNDPATHTGLAHYLEHLLFKGTDKFGSADWEKEKPLLAEIEKLYEQYNSTTDEEKRKKIYQSIDEVSGEAAKYAIANEYDKMMASMGAQGTNAFTSFEQTVYTEDIPSNAIDKYLAVQAERFRNPVYRLFHTELEAVYEEKNRSLDSDGSKVFEQIFSMLFPNNKYGTQTTIGTIEHLKNPSLVEIQKYFETYYVPNNMALIMAGDFEPNEVIAKIDEKFSYMKSKPLPEYTVNEEEPISQPKKAEVVGPESEEVLLGYRFPGVASSDAQILKLVGKILTNGSAGLIDLNLVKEQKLLDAFAFPYVLKDYSTLLLGGEPTEGQKLEEVERLLLTEIEKLKKGEFSDDLITSILNNEKKSTLQENENYTRRAYNLMDNFTLDDDWAKRVAYVQRLEKITKRDIMAFAQRYFRNNYVTVYKRQGKDENAKQVDKPQITPVEVNRDDASEFLQAVNELPENEIQPVWLDFKKDIQQNKAGKYDLLSVPNPYNDLFSLTYYFETGSWSDKLLPVAVDFLEYLGTKDKSASEFSQEFYQLATDFNVYYASENSYITLNGLQENFEKSVQLFDELLTKCVPDDEAFESYLRGLIKQRKDAKKSRFQIKNGLQNYAVYGEKNPFNNEFSDEELHQLRAKDLTDLLHKMAKYQHKILYYGSKSGNEIATTLAAIHKAPSSFVSLPEPVVFEQITPEENTVLFTDYDMVQAEIYWRRVSSKKYKEKMVPTALLFNQYYGGNMGSIVFQTIRESKALAYSTFAYYSLPSDKKYRPSFVAYVGTQADKFDDAIEGMNELLNEMPKSEKAMQIAKEGMRKKLATERVTGSGILFHYLDAQKMGRNYDIRKNVYERVSKLDFEDLKAFFEEEIKGKNFTYCVLSNKENISEEQMQKLGTVKTLSLKEIFGY